MSQILATRIASRNGLKFNTIWNRLKAVYIAKRTVLSSAYACEDIWNSHRKECETLKNITPGLFYSF